MKADFVYILAPSYSGSTLLTMMLAQHPEVTTIGELKASSMGDLAAYHCSCGQKIDDCPYWTRLSAAVDGGFDLSSPGTHYRHASPLLDKILRIQPRTRFHDLAQRLLLSVVPGANRAKQDITRRNIEVIESCLSIDGNTCFLDGSKDANRLNFIAQSGHFNVKVIEMHRNGLGQAHSARKKQLHEGNFDRCVSEWQNTVLEMKTVLKRTPGLQCHLLQYERLCEDPNEVMQDLLRFLQLPPLAVNWSELDIASTEHHILGNNNARTNDIIRISLDEKWREEIGLEERQQFERIAGSTNARLGYHN